LIFHPLTPFLPKGYRGVEADSKRKSQEKGALLSQLAQRCLL